MILNKTVNFINAVSGERFSESEADERLILLSEDTRGILYRIDGVADTLTNLNLHLYISKEASHFQRVGNFYQLQSLYMHMPKIVAPDFLSDSTLNIIYDMLLDKEDWKDSGNTLQKLKAYLFSLFNFFFKYRNNNNILGDPNSSSVVFPTRLLASSGNYIYLSGTVKDGCLTDTALVNPCRQDKLPSLDIALPELNVELDSISIDAPYKTCHMKSRLQRAGTDKDVSEFMMQLKTSIGLVNELKRTSPFVILPGYSMKLNEINLLVPYFESLKDGLKPKAYIPLRRSEDGFYRPQTVYSLDITKRAVRLFGYTHISGGALQ